MAGSASWFRGDRTQRRRFSILAYVHFGSINIREFARPPLSLHAPRCVPAPLLCQQSVSSQGPCATLLAASRQLSDAATFATISSAFTCARAPQANHLPPPPSCATRQQSLRHIRILHESRHHLPDPRLTRRSNSARNRPAAADSPDREICCLQILRRHPQ